MIGFLPIASDSFPNELESNTSHSAEAEPSRPSKRATEDGSRPDARRAGGNAVPMQPKQPLCRAATVISSHTDGGFGSPLDATRSFSPAVGDGPLIESAGLSARSCIEIKRLGVGRIAEICSAAAPCNDSSSNSTCAFGWTFASIFLAASDRIAPAWAVGLVIELSFCNFVSSKRSQGELEQCRVGLFNARAWLEVLETSYGISDLILGARIHTLQYESTTTFRSRACTRCVFMG